MSDFKSVPDMFLQRVRATPEAPAFLHPDGAAWRTLTWRETGERVRALACGLLALGQAPEERCAILSGTRLEWILADLAILCAGGATTTIYPANTAEECVYILQDCEAVLVFAEDAAQLAKLASRRPDLPTVKHVVVFDGEGGHGGWALSLAELVSLGKAHDAAHPEAYEAAANAVDTGRLATLIYTSGTTGKPKGVELTHDCWVYEAWAIDAIELLTPQDLQLLWLPLAHVFGKVLEAAQLRIGFASAVDGRVDKLVENMKAVQPTFMCAVPRIFEKVYNKVLGSVQQAGGLKYRIFRWAYGVGKTVAAMRHEGRAPSSLLAAQARLADALVLKKVRATFGGRLRFFVSGSAPLSKELAEFFHAFGVLILEGYGLTESSAATFVNRVKAYKLGTVGQPLPGTEAKVAPDGEILIRGRGIMRRYHNKPEATAEVLDADGWLSTGDIGELDAEGFLKITDRKKDLIKTSGGKYVAPQALEAKLKLQSRFISIALVHGNNRNFCSALLTLNEDVLAWASQQGLGDRSYAELAGDARVRELIQKAVDEVNATLAKHETIKKFEILPADLTVEAGELTPSLKVRRREVERKYGPVLESFYAGSVKEI